MAVETFEPESQESQVFGDYEVVSKIAEGGMATVYKGRNRVTGQTVAIKVLSPHMAKNAVIRRRLEQEYNAAHQLNHPNIVRALDFCGDDPAPYLVMEFVDGESLGARVERTSRLPEEEAIRLITQVALGLQKAHSQGLIHRDVKPDNILVDPDGQAKLTDLGLVKELEADLNLTRTGRGLGTPHFMAPEQFRNAKNADIRCDVYSLGATLYQLVTGALPFDGCGPVDAWMKKLNSDLPTPRQLVPDLSERVDWAIRRAMSPDPIQRPNSCWEFVEDLTGHSTQRLGIVTEDLLENLWYLHYKDDEGVVHTVKGPLSGVRHSLKEWVLGSITDVRAARDPAGPFELLRDLPEFRDLIFEPPAPACGLAATSTTLPHAPAAGYPTRADIAPPDRSAPRAGKPPEKKPALAPVIVQLDAGPNDSYKWVLLLILAALSGVAVTYYLVPFIRSLRLFW